MEHWSQPAQGGREGDVSADAALIARAADGEEPAQRQLWHEHRRWVAAVLLAHMPRDADLDDLLQEVAVTLVAKVSSVREPGALRPWLRAVAISVAKTAARRRQVRRAGWFKLVSFKGAREDDGADEQSEPRRAAMNEGRQLMELCAELPEGYREPLLLKCVQGMSYREIGRVMNVPETTVETRIARARRMLRERATSAGLGGGADTGAGEDDAGTRGLVGVGAGRKTIAGERA